MWNAQLYGTYKKERSQPSVDLVNRIKDNDFKRILDAGCGSGMSTAALAAVFKNAEIIGADLSENMLEAAKKTLPEIDFVQRDCGEPLYDMGKFDLIFSNAFMQWLTNQEEFINNSFEMLNENGVFAAQIPLSHLMPIRSCINEAKSALPERLQNTEVRTITSFLPNDYYDMLSKLSDKVSIWVTDYFHVMDSHKSILDFIRGTALNPYTEKLDENECERFLDKVLDNIKKAYAVQSDGNVLFPFKRLFIIAEK